MASCIRCGGMLEEFDAGGDMVCDACEARGSGAGGSGDVPCQRCGMYLPSHELQMWNSRLYCAYCIMDVKDEDRYGKGSKSARLEQGLEATPIKQLGTCQRCGKSSDEFYTLHGMNFCPGCYFSEGGPGVGSNKPSRFGQMVKYVKEKLKVIVLKPLKILSDDPRPQKKEEQVFDLRGRKMKDRKDLEMESRKAESAPNLSGEEMKAPMHKEEIKEEKKSEKKPGADQQKPFYLFKDKSDGKKKS